MVAGLGSGSSEASVDGIYHFTYSDRHMTVNQGAIHPLEYQFLEILMKHSGIQIYREVILYTTILKKRWVS